MKQLVLIGYPLEHSLSPVMHNAALKEMGLEKSYRYSIHPTLLHELEDRVESFRSGDLEGANITIPYKTDIMSHLDSLSDEALAVGAVNTIYLDNEKLLGHNTDVLGFQELLRECEVPLRGISVLIIGAGGAARSVGYALVQAGIVSLKIYNRTQNRAEVLASSLSRLGSCEITIESSLDNQDFQDTDLIVNCTPVGMSGHSEGESPLDSTCLQRDMTVIDLVYNPQTTKLLLDAERIGCTIIDGTGMLVHQGAAALELWTGEKPPVEVMRNSVLRILGA
jgi:shikimate dehydrogenase